MNSQIRFLIFTILIVITLPTLGACAKKEKPAPPQQEQAQEGPNLGKYTADPAKWGAIYPEVYETYKLNTITTDEYSKYGGSVRKPKFEKDKFLKPLYAGYGFGEDYNEERSHAYSVTDVSEIKRKKPGGTCLTCKTADYSRLTDEMGVEFFSEPFDNLIKKVEHPITCLDCHDPKTGKLRITRLHLRAELKRQGKDPDNLPEKELRNLVCAQCHIEYYFKKETKEVLVPWEKGYSPGDFLAVYNEEGFKDWEHPQSGTQLIKIQHPEYEFYQGSTHFEMGATCVDCHMPKVEVKGKKITSHHITSPLYKDYIDKTCARCHSKTSREEMKNKVIKIQDQTWELYTTAGEKVEAAMKAIAAAKAGPGVNMTKLTEAQDLHRSAQLYWDFHAAENSMGFHDPAEAKENLRKAAELADQALAKANEAK